MAKKTITFIFKKAKSFRANRQFPIRNIILHSTDGREAGDVATLTGNKVSVHWYVTRAGKVFRFVKDEHTAFHAGVVFNPAFNGNDATVGIEQEHFDGKEDWPDAQIKKVAQITAFLIQTHGLKNREDIKSHAEVAKPKGRKQDPLKYPFKAYFDLVDEALKDTWSIEEA